MANIVTLKHGAETTPFYTGDFGAVNFLDTQGKILPEDIRIEVSSDDKFTASNIKSGVSIFGTAGTFTSDATAAAGDILASKTAYASGSKLTGTIPTKTDADITSSGGTVTIPAGYYAKQYTKQGDPSGDATMTSGDQMLSGITAYSKGTKYTGTIPTKTSTDLTASGATVTAPAGYYASAATKTIASGNVAASVSSNTAGSASMAATGFTAAASGSYYVTLSTTAGSVKAKATGVDGYVTSSTTNETAATSVSVSGNGNKLYVPTNTITGSVDSLSAPSVAVSGAATGFTPASSATACYVTVSGSGTNGSVKGKATVGSTTGIVASGATNTSAATTITPGITGSGSKVYIPVYDYSYTIS